MALSSRHYGDYLTQICALCGVPTSRLSTELAASFNAFWNTAFTRTFSFYDFVEVCPYGEARFVGNKFGYANNLAQTSEWTPTALTITGNSISDPLDGRVTASKLLETAVTSAHSVAHSTVSIVPSTTYNYSAYVRPNNRSWVYLKIDDGDLVHSCFYNVTTGVLGTQLNCTANIQQVGSGFYLCNLQFTTSTSITATTSAITLQTSTDGSTLSFLGDVTKGLYVWGMLMQQITNTGPSDALVSYSQTGEAVMDAVFMCWMDSPFGTPSPRPQGYILTANGIQVISGSVVFYAVVNSAGVSITTQMANPIFLYYRKAPPTFSGSTYSASATYAVNDQIYFTNAAGTADYWKCIVATTAGQSPDTTAASWEVLDIPDSIFWPSVYQAFGDWLTSDGQGDKAIAAYQIAQTKLDDICEKQSRQQGRNFPMTVQTHVSSQLRTW